MYEYKYMNGIINQRHYKNTETISPGVVGSVGDTLCQVRLKHSAPDMPIRWEKWTAGKNEEYLGSNVQDGYSASFSSGGRGPVTLDTEWGYSDGFKIQNGWRMQDISEPDKLVVPQDLSTPQYSWKNKLATNYESKRTGNMFLPAPQELRVTVVEPVLYN